MSLLLALAACGAFQGTTTEPHLMRFPTVQGDTVVFSYAGDLWVTQLHGGIARRLTSHPGVETRPHLSADGRTVAFSGSYEGPPNIYTIPIEGGEPTRLTYDVEGDACLGWAPDGKIAYASTGGNFTNRQPKLWLVSPKGGLPTSTPINEIGELSYFGDGKTIAYNRINSWGFNWRRYRGGSQGRISIYNFAENRYSELPSGREQSYFPMVVGRSIFYISDKVTGTQNLYRYDLDAKREVQLTKFADADMRTPSTDGKTIVFERDGLVYSYDIATAKIEKVETRILSENLNSRPYLRSLANQITDMTLSPSGLRVAVNARGEIFSVAAKEGDTRNVTQSTASRERYPRWSPDGTTIAYVSDATGNREIYTRPQLGGDAVQLTRDTTGTIESLTWSPDGKYLQFTKSDTTVWILNLATRIPVKVTDAPYGFTGSDWSPDGKWIAFTMNGKNLQSAVYAYEVATGKTTQLSSGYYNDAGVAFDQNGKYLYLISAREFATSNAKAVFTMEASARPRVFVIPLAKDTANPLTVSSDEEPGTQGPPPVPSPAASSGNATKIDFDGINSRVLELPISGDSFESITGGTNGVFVFGEGRLQKFDLATRDATPLLAGAQRVVFNSARTKMAYTVGERLGVLDVRPGGAVGQGLVNLSAVEAVINPRDEWRQIFWEAWRFERDHYYDANFRGLNWNAIGQRYAGYLPDVNSRSDLNYVIGLMIGELGTSHAYVSGGDFGNVGRPIPIGYLGADYEVADGHVRFKKILRGHSYEESARGPLAEPGIAVHDGDFLLEIDGQPINANVNPASRLMNKVGRYVTLTVNNSTSLTGARKVRVRPIGSEGLLRYWDFADTNRQRVAELSGGRIGYVHVRDTGAPGTMDLYRGFFPQTDKDALIVDERWNGGGNLPNGFVELLARRFQTGLQQRNGADVGDAAAIEGPKAMLINGYAGSGGDMFPWLFRQNRVGPLIGKRTWGGLVGINDGIDLVDGGTVTAPEFSIYDRETGEIIGENRGIDPDIDVDNRPDLVAQGRDPQLERAIEVLLEALKKSPPRAPRKDLPKVGREGRIGG